MIPFMTMGGLGRSNLATMLPAEGDIYFQNVVSLLHFNGADASTTFTDQTGRAWTAVGNAQIDTAQFKFGGAAGLLDGSGDYLSSAASSDFYFGAADFTIEGFIRMTGSLPTAGQYKFIACRDNVASTRGWRLLVDGDVGGKLVFSDNVGGTAYTLADTAAMALNTWVHIAVSRVGNTLRLFRDGVLVDSESVTGLTFNNSSVDTLIGTGRNGSPVVGWSWKGHLDEFRITKGVGRYTADFSVPTSAYPDSGFGKTEARALYDKLLFWYEMDAANYIAGEYHKDLKTNSSVASRLGNRVARTGATVLGVSADGQAFASTAEQYCRSEVTSLRGQGNIAIRAAVLNNYAHDSERVITLHGKNPAPETWGSSADNINWKFYVDVGGVPKVSWQYGSGSWETAIAAGSALATPASSSVYMLGFDRDVATKEVTHIRNGVRESAQAYTNDPTDGTGSSTYPFIGGIPSGSYVGNKKIGGLQRVTIWSGPLSQAEDTYLYGNGSPKTFAELTALAAVYWNQVSALLHFDGADGSTTFTDEKGKTWTASGNAQIDTAQSKFGGAAGLFDGTGDFISTPDSADFDFGSGDFTVEFWLRPNSITGFQNIIGKRTGVNYAPFTIGLSSGQLRYRLSKDNASWAADVTSAATLSVGGWVHVALTRSGTNLRQFINGVIDGTGTISGAVMTNTSAVYVGAQSDGASAYNGHIDDLRITKGVARYTANFTPPAAPYDND